MSQGSGPEQQQPPRRAEYESLLRRQQEAMARATELMGDGEYQQAANFLAGEIREDTDNTELLKLWGQAEIELGEPERVVQVLQLLTNAYQRNAERPLEQLDLLVTLADAHARIGNYDQALACGRGVLQQQPDHPNFQYIRQTETTTGGRRMVAALKGQENEAFSKGNISLGRRLGERAAIANLVASRQEAATRQAGTTQGSQQ